MGEAGAEDVVPLHVDTLVRVVDRVPDEGASEGMDGVALGCVVTERVPHQHLPAGQERLKNRYHLGVDDGTPSPCDARIAADGRGRTAAHGGARPTPRLLED